MPPRYYTVEQANRALPELIPILERLRETKRRLDTQTSQQAELRRKAQSNGHNHAAELAGVGGEIERTTQEAKDLVSQITAQGIELKDIESGLVDFPTIHRDRRVLLCWKLGEPAVAYWHDTQSGFAGRQPIRPREDV